MLWRIGGLTSHFYYVFFTRNTTLSRAYYAITKHKVRTARTDSQWQGAILKKRWCGTCLGFVKLHEPSLLKLI
jgi:hypothetical protein